MPEYIEREALLKHALLENTRLSDNAWQRGYWHGVDVMAEFIKEQPTADVVEVVRCRDCIHFSNDTDYCREHNKGYCELDNVIKPSTYFCSYGKRKEVKNA